MRSRFLPYATTAGRLLAQLFGDAVIAAWTCFWLLVGLAVHTAIAAIGDVGRQVEAGAHGSSGNLASAGDGAGSLPFLGETISKPLTAANAAALDIAGAGHNLDSTAGWLAALLAIAVAAPPIGALAAPWLVLRLRFFRRKRAVLALAGTAAGQQLLALRARTNRSVHKLTAISPDPVDAWRRGDPHVIRGLVGVELRSAGLARRPAPARLPV